MNTLIRKFQNLSNRQVLAILLGVAIGTSGMSALVRYGLDGKVTPEWWEGWLQNFSTEMFGAFLTFILLELIVGTRQERQRLIAELRSDDEATVKDALRQIEENGWLYDGSLQGAKLHGANLTGTYLVGADLAGARLRYTNLQGAMLDGARMNRAKLKGANLSDADSQHAKLQRADSRYANLSGANLQSANLCGANLYNSTLTSANLEQAVFNEFSTLPNGSKWTPDTDMARFTDVEHPDFWQPGTDE